MLKEILFGLRTILHDCVDVLYLFLFSIHCFLCLLTPMICRVWLFFFVVFMLCYTAYSVHHPFNKGTAKNLKFYPCWIKAKPTHLHHKLGVSGCIRKCHIINSKIDIEISASEKLWMTAAWLQNHLTTIKMYFLITS